MKGSIIPVFTTAAIFNNIDDFVREKIEKIMQTLAYVGEMFVNEARTTRSYKDQTGNLRSSIGYVIGFNGNIVKKDLQGKQDGKTRALELAREIIEKHKEGFVLVGFAGMEYAASVESKGYDVITGSVPTAEILLKHLKEELKAA